jgi:uncharacterized membrane protein HdeD (DUF308 family)
MIKKLGMKSAEMQVARQSSEASIGFGMLLIILGFFAVMAPTFTGIGVTILIGMMLLTSSIIEIVFAFKSKSFGQGILKFLFGAIGVIAGIIILLTPMFGLGVLTIMMVAFFLGAGILEIIHSFSMKDQDGWGWLIFSGIVSILLAIFLIAQWPASGIWAVGIFVGVRILMHGVVLVSVGKSGQELLTQLQDSRIELLERHLLEGSKLLKELQVTVMEQAAMLSVFNKELKTKVSSSDVDPALKDLNKDLGEARDWMKDVSSTTMKSWDELQKDSKVVFDKLKDKADDITKDLKKSLGLDKG